MQNEQKGLYHIVGRETAELAADPRLQHTGQGNGVMTRNQGPGDDLIAGLRGNIGIFHHDHRQLEQVLFEHLSKGILAADLKGLAVERLIIFHADK